MLRYLHEKLGVAHNNINPENVMVQVPVRGGRAMPMPLLAGFGMARKIGERIAFGERSEGEREVFWE